MGLLESSCVACSTTFMWYTGGPRLCEKCYVPQPNEKAAPVIGRITFSNHHQGSNIIDTSGSVLEAVGFKVPDRSNPLLKDAGYAVAYLVDKIRKHGFADPITQKALFDVYEACRDMELP